VLTVNGWVGLVVELLGDPKAGIYCRGCGAPILMQFEPAGAALDHLDQRSWVRGVALAEEAEIDRKPLRRLQNAPQMPGTWRAGRRGGPGGRPGTSAEHRRDPAVQGLVHQLRTDEMNMRVDAAGGNDAVFAGNGLGSRSDHDVHPRLDIGVTSLADAADVAVADADIGFDDTPMVEDHRVGDDSIDGALGARRLPLPHAVADNLAAAELDFLTIDRAIALNFDDEIRICQPHAVPNCRTKHLGIGAARDGHRHRAIPTGR